MRYFVIASLSFIAGLGMQPGITRIDRYLNPPIRIEYRNDITNLCFTYKVLTVEKKAFAPLPWWEQNCRVMF